MAHSDQAVTCPRCRQPALQELLTPPFGSWCPCGFTVPEVSSPEEFGAYIALERNKTPPVLADRLPTSAELRAVHLKLDALVKFQRARAAERADGRTA